MIKPRQKQESHLLRSDCESPGMIESHFDPCMTLLFQGPNVNDLYSSYIRKKKKHKQNRISKLPHLVRIWRLVSYYLLCLSLQYLTYEDCLKKVYEAAEHCRAQSDETQLSVSFNDICDGYQEKLKRLCLAHSAKGLYWLSKKLV